MQVQKIQSTNNYQNQSFKAKLLNDANGNFLRLWNAADKSASGFKDCVDVFTKCPEHILEIINIRKSNLHQNMKAYDIFNHNTGKMKTFYNSSEISERMILGLLLSKISLSDELFEENEISKLYNRLTGNN